MPSRAATSSATSTYSPRAPGPSLLSGRLSGSAHTRSVSPASPAKGRVMQSTRVTTTATARGIGPVLRSRQLEDEERTALGTRVVHLLADRAEELRDRERPTADHGHVLLAIERVRHRRRADPRARVELPELLTGTRIERLEPAPDVAVEHEAAGGGQRAAEPRQLVLVAPDLLLLDRIPRDELTHVATGAALAEVELEGQVERAALVRRHGTFHIHAEVQRRDVDEPRLRV